MKTQRTYQKVINVCCFLFIFVNIGFSSTSFNVFQTYIAQAVGDANASLVVSARTAVSLLCMFLVARWYKLLDCRLGITLATLMTATGFVLYSLATSLPLYCVASAITGAGYGLGGMVGMTLLIGRWYSDHIGTAVGLSAMGSGVCSMIMPLLSTYVIHTFSLQTAFLLEAVIAAALALVIFALLRNYPADAPKEQQQETGTQAVAQPSILTPKLHLVMMGGMVLMGCIAVGGQGYLGILMTSNGFDAYFAATLLTVSGICLSVAKAVNGVVFDAVGTKRGSMIFFTLMVLGAVFYTQADRGNPYLMTCGVVLYSTGVTLGTVGISVWSIDLSTPADRVKLVRDLQVCYAAGSFVINMVPGPLMEITGSYTTSYWIMLVMCAVCFAAVMFVYTAVERKNRTEA